MKQRIEYIDLAKGICILLVVIDHTYLRHFFGNKPYPLYSAFIQMRMPLYFILSGLFFKDYAGGIAEFVLRKVNRILIPDYFFYFTLYGITGVVLSLTGYEMGRVCSAQWFLICLFEMNVVFVLLYTLTKRLFSRQLVRDVALAILVFCVGTIGYHVGMLPWYFGSVMTCLPFLWIGYLLNRRISFFQWNIKWWVALPLGMALIYGLNTIRAHEFFYRNFFDVPLPQVYATGTIGTLGVLLISRVLKHLPVISYIGRYSIIVLIMHQFWLSALTPLIRLMHLPTPWSGFVILASCIALCMGCCWVYIRYIPWFCAQKDLIPLRWLDKISCMLRRGHQNPPSEQ